MRHVEPVGRAQRADAPIRADRAVPARAPHQHSVEGEQQPDQEQERSHQLPPPNMTKAPVSEGLMWFWTYSTSAVTD